MKASPRFGFVIEYVSNIEAARSFYENVLGLQVQRQHPTFVQFDHFAIASDASMDGTNKREIYWLVDDVQAVYDDLTQQVEALMPLTDMPFGRVFGVNGPDCQPQYVLELAKNRPSEPVAEGDISPAGDSR